ncbi:MAG TPA: pyrroline-5-carboxylate reductase [Candidatus Baltobacteraceae bacterium]|nr:pyrroline-5-carboxylate reductase [Candidatus Baltobacteraceae bacterium]
MNIGILGCGTLGRVLAAGLRGHADVGDIFATTRNKNETTAGLPHVQMLEHNSELAQRSDVLFLCVKPFQVEAVLREIAPMLKDGPLVISVAASVNLAKLVEWSGGAAAMIRAMPNMPCRIGEGMTVIATSDGAGAGSIALAQSLFERLGRVAVIDESLMDAATGLSGCGPAYAYLIIEALTQAGVKLGIPRTTSLLLAAQTLLGAAKMVIESGAHPAVLKDDVTTPAGCTIDGLIALEKGNLRSTLLNAVVSAAHRSATLS